MLTKVLLFLEMEAYNHRFAHNLSKFSLKKCCDITKRNDL